MSATMTLRPATHGDLPRILAIYNHEVLHSTVTADLEPQTLPARRQWLDDRLHAGLPVLVADDAGEVAGWAALSRYHTRPGYRFTVENSVYVDAARRGQGIGRQLLAALVDEAPRRGFRTIIAAVADQAEGDDNPSLRLHRAAGFTDAGRLRRVVYKLERWIDVVYLQKSVG